MTEIRYFKTIRIQPVVDYLYEVISEKLNSGVRTLWLIPGGSAMKIVVAVAEKLVESNVNLSNLIVTLTDERYGDVGHSDSNWLQLGGMGFDLPGATLQPVLTGEDQFMTAENYANNLREDFRESGYKIGLFGMGPDGHTAGILPRTSAVAATELTHAYDGGAFQRITITERAIKHLDEAVLFAVGHDKWPMIERLDEDDMPITNQPAQILKQLEKLTIYNDLKGVEIDMTDYTNNLETNHEEPVA